MSQLVLYKMTLFFEFVTAIRACMFFAIMLLHVPPQVTVVRKLGGAARMVAFVHDRAFFVSDDMFAQL